MLNNLSNINSEFVIVLLIIVVSSLFATSYGKQYNCQLLFILTCLGIILVYKMLLYNRFSRFITCMSNPSNKAGFTDFTQEINDFLGTVPSDINNQASAQEYKSKLTELQDKVDIMNEYLADLKTQLNAKRTGSTLTDQYNIQASQQVQDYRIRKLTEDIQRANDLIKESQLRTDSAKYKKIPVMSSCIVQQADGSIGIDTNLQKSSVGTATGSGNATPVGTPVRSSQPGSASLASPAGAQSGLIPATGSNDQVTIQKLLEAVSANGINVTLKN
jgi:hypothetical protein